MGRRFPVLVLIVLLASALLPGHGSSLNTQLVAIGGGYSDVYPGLCRAIVQRAENRAVRILVLPSAYSTSAEAISEGERAVNLRDAEVRRYEIEQACLRAGEGLQVTALIVPVFTRADALLPENAALFSADVSAIFILGGDQTVAMRAIANTPIEQAMADLYARGTLVSGTSAGGGMLASSMLAGYNPNFAAETALRFGAVDVWNSADLHGLSFSLQNSILDQHFFQRARLGRLLNAILLPGVPHIGIGVDAYTGVNISNQARVEGVFGLYTVSVLDAETYHADQSLRYVGEDHLLSVRNVLLHLLAEESASYDLAARRSSLAEPAPHLERTADFLSLPQGAGDLYIAGNLLPALPDSPVLAQFEDRLPAGEGSILILAAGYRSKTAANAEAKKYQAALQTPSEVVYVPSDLATEVEIPAGTKAILVVGKDQSLLAPAALARVEDAWRQGMPLLLDNAPAALAGEFYSCHEPTPSEGEGVENATQRSFLQGRTRIEPGLGLIQALFEPRLVSDNRWGRLFSLAYNHPQLPAFGLQDGTALWISRQGAAALGDNGIFSLDLRFAALGLGKNEGFEIANALLDVFQPGEPITYLVADSSASYERAPTPQVQLLTPTALDTPTLSPTPSPTSTPEPPEATQAPRSTPPATLAPQPAPGGPGSTPWPLLLGAGLIAGLLFLIVVRALKKK